VSAGGPQPFRITPGLPVHAFKTYALSAPLSTHYRPARCEEVNCPNHAAGWRTVVDTLQPLGVTQAKYIMERAGRKYTMTGPASPGATLTFTFPPGQQCFASHTVPLEREPIYVVRDGDWRGNPTGRRMTHVRAADWVDDFASHQAELIKEIERG